jgi:peptidoglycan-associated lipoprotein
MTVFNSKWLNIFLVILLGLSVGACGRKKQQPPALTDMDSSLDEMGSTGAGSGYDSGSGTVPSASDWDTSEDRPLTRRPYGGEWLSDSNLGEVYFDYNSFKLNAQAQRTLQANADYLRSKPNLRVLVEGHCDDRGTEEYNQALGEKRAIAARDFLVELGLSESQIDIITYGEMRPAATGSGESAWKLNRRAEFKVAG